MAKTILFDYQMTMEERKTVSKTQEKRAQRLAEQEAFIKQRRMDQYLAFQANFDAGLKIYEANKDKLTPEQIAQLNAEIEHTLESLKEFKEKWL